MTATSFTLRHPCAPSNAQGDAYAIHFRVINGAVEIMDCVNGGMGGTSTLDSARKFYADKLAEGYSETEPWPA